MKKFFAILMCFCIVFSQTIISLAALDINMITSSKENSAIKVVRDLGLITLPEYVSDATVRRQDLAEIVASIMLDGNIPSVSESVFSDVGKRDEKASYIIAAYNLGIMNGYFDGSFQPFRIITYNEIIKTLVCMLGYEDYAEYKGGWPTGYQIVAAELKLDRGINVVPNGYVNLGQACMMVQRALETTMMFANSVTSDGIQHNVVKGRTLLTEYMEIEILEGQLTSNHLISLRGNASAQRGVVTIAGNQYVSIAPELDYQLGQNLKCYVKNIDNRPSVIAYEKNNKGIELRLYDEDIVTIEDSKIVYLNENNKNNSLKFDGNTELIYNGDNIYPWNKSNIPVTNCEIRLIDYDEDGKCDFIFANRFESFVVSSYQEDNNTIYLDTQLTKKRIICLEGDEGYFYELRDSNGQVIPPNDLKKGDILSIAQSSDGNINIMYRSSKYVEGEMTKISDTVLTIDGVNYAFDDAWRHSVGDTLLFNKKGIFYLDYRDRVVSVSYDDKLIRKYGYFVDIGSTSGIEETVQIRMFCSDGQFKIFSLQDKLLINGEKQKASAVLTDFNFVNNNSAIPQLVQYDTNAEGKISVLYSAEPGENYSSDDERNLHFTLDEVVTASIIGSSVKMLGSRYIIPDDIITFVVPKDITEEEKFYIMSPSDHLSDTYMPKARLYDVDADNRLSVVVIQYDQSNMLGVRSQGVITGIEQAIDAEGNEGIKFSVMTSPGTISDVFLVGDVSANTWDGIYSNSDVNYYIGSDGYRYIKQEELRIGDMIMYFRSKRTGKYIDGRLIFRPGENLASNEVCAQARSESKNNSLATALYGEIVKKVDGALVVRVPDTSNSLDPGWTRICPIQENTNILKINERTGKPEQISVEELEVGEKVFVFCQFALVRVIMTF